MLDVIPSLCSMFIYYSEDTLIPTRVLFSGI